MKLDRMAKMLGLGVAVTLMARSAPAALVDYYSFNEASSGTAPAIDTVGGHNGVFQGTATRTTGLSGVGAALFNNAGGDAVDVGNSFSASTGIGIRTLIKPSWNPKDASPYDEIFRKEDGNNRILFSFQNDTNGGGAQPPVAAGPVLSFGLNIGGTYNELDMLLDGTNGGVTLNTAAPAGGVELEDGNAHSVAATYDSSTGVKAIYVDGVLRDSVTVSGLITSGGVADATIGNVGPGGNEPFTGVIDEVGLYNSPIPEPASAAILTLSATLLLARRRGVVRRV